MSVFIIPQMYLVYYENTDYKVTILIDAFVCISHFKEQYSCRDNFIISFKITLTWKS